MDIDQRLLEEAYDASIESERWNRWLSRLKGHSRRGDGTIDVDGDVKLGDKQLTKIPFKFGIVTGHFDCSMNNKLVTLEGAPLEVGKSFSCCECNNLKSLEGAPLKVGWNFNCYNCNSLESLEKAPSQVLDFNCWSCNELRSLEGSPTGVGGYFNCSHCSGLISLKGGPLVVGAGFNCYNCKSLGSLKFIPGAESYDVRPFTQADVDRELRRRA